MQKQITYSSGKNNVFVRSNLKFTQICLVCSNNTIISHHQLSSSRSYLKRCQNVSKLTTWALQQNMLLHHVFMTNSRNYLRHVLQLKQMICWHSVIIVIIQDGLVLSCLVVILHHVYPVKHFYKTPQTKYEHDTIQTTFVLSLIAHWFFSKQKFYCLKISSYYI